MEKTRSTLSPNLILHQSALSFNLTMVLPIFLSLLLTFPTALLPGSLHRLMHITLDLVFLCPSQKHYVAEAKATCLSSGKSPSGKSYLCCPTFSPFLAHLVKVIYALRSPPFLFIDTLLASC